MRKGKIGMNNPYLQAKLLWHDLYGNMEQKLRYAQILNFVLLAMLAFTLIACLKLSLRSKYQPIPFIIHGNELLVAQEQPTINQTLKNKLALVLTQQFIQHARSYFAQNIVNKQQHIQAFAITHGSALTVLQNYIATQQNNAQTNTIHIQSIIRQAQQNLIVRWREEQRNLNGEIQQKHHYIAHLHYVFATKPDNEELLKYNPLNFYIDNLAWSEEIL